MPDGRQLLTLKGAADYINKLPKQESDLPEWQTAIEALMLCSRGRPTMTLGQLSHATTSSMSDSNPCICASRDIGKAAGGSAGRR